MGQKFMLNEDVQDKAKILKRALNRQFNKKFHTMVIGMIDGEGNVKVGMSPFNEEKLEAIDLIEMGHYITNVGIRLGYKKGNT